MICKNCGTYVPDNADKCQSCYMPIVRDEQSNKLITNRNISNEIVEEPIIIKQPVIVEKAIIVEQPLVNEQHIIEEVVECSDEVDEVEEVLPTASLKIEKKKIETNKVLLIVGITFGVLLLIGAIVAGIMLLTISNMEVEEQKEVNIKEEIVYEIEEVEKKEENVKKEDKYVENEIDEEEKENSEKEKDTALIGEHLTLEIDGKGKIKSNRFAKGLRIEDEVLIEGYYLPVGVYSISGDGVWNLLRPFGEGKNRKWDSIGTIESQEDNLVYLSYSDKEMKMDMEYRIGKVLANSYIVEVELNEPTYFTTYGKEGILNIEKIKEYEKPIIKEDNSIELKEEETTKDLDNSKIICEYIVGLGVIDNDFTREIKVSGEEKYGYVIPKGTYRVEGGTKDAYLVLVRNIKYEGKKQNIEYGAIEVSDKNVSYYLYDTKYIASEDDLPLSILQEDGKSVIIEFENDIFVHPDGRNGQIKFTLVD